MDKQLTITLDPRGVAARRVSLRAQILAQRARVESLRAQRDRLSAVLAIAENVHERLREERAALMVGADAD